MEGYAVAGAMKIPRADARSRTSCDAEENGESNEKARIFGLLDLNARASPQIRATLVF